MTLSVSQYVNISWQPAIGATSYDVLRTTTPTAPTAACNCAVATGVTSPNTLDQAEALGAYTVSTADPAQLAITLSVTSPSSGNSFFVCRKPNGTTTCDLDTIRTGTYNDFVLTTAPSNPPAGQVRLYGDSGTGNLACITSAGASCISGGGGGSWSALTNPVANLSLNTGTFTSTWTVATGTGASNIFTFTTAAAANGTGYVGTYDTGAGSTMNPFRVRAQGSSLIDCTPTGCSFGGASNYTNFASQSDSSTAGDFWRNATAMKFHDGTAARTLFHSGSTIGTANGGTNLTSIGTANQVLGVNNGATGLEYKTITAGSNVTVTHGANSITIASSAGSTSPQTTISLVDEFVGGSGSSSTIGTLGWTLNNHAGTTTWSASANNAAQSFTNFGVGLLRSGSTSGDCGNIAIPANTSTMRYDTNANWEVQWVVKLENGSASTTRKIRVGLHQADACQPTNGVWLRYDTEAGFTDTNWQLCVRSTVTTTEQCYNTATAPSNANFVRLRIRSTSVGTWLISLYDNAGAIIGAEKSICSASCDLTATLPAVGLRPAATTGTATSQVRGIDIDMFSYVASVTR